MNVKEKKPAPRLVVLFEPWEPNRDRDLVDATHYRLVVMWVPPNNDGPRNCSHSSAWEYPGIELFEDFEFQCYVNWYGGQFHAESWTVRYSGYMILDRVDEAERMVKGLKKAEKIQQSFPIRPATFGQFVSLMAAGFGIKELCRKSRRFPDGWQYLPLSYLQELIDEQIEHLRKLKIEGVIPPAEDAA